MKIAQLSGAYVNAGDFLIQDRATYLLRSVYPNAEIRLFLRTNIERDFDEIEQCDVIVFTGGPLIMTDIDKSIPVKKSMQFTKPIMMLGCGWYGDEGNKSNNFTYYFTEGTLAFYRKVTQEGYGIGCRDIYTYRALLAYGLNNVHMTGCPAWYNPNLIYPEPVIEDKEIKSICISDPARPSNQKQCMSIIAYLHLRYPHANITFVFHRDIDEMFKALLQETYPHARIVSISGSTEGFSVYDKCDLHVGYRVHAHIYNLSLCKKTILIEEDGRGAGVNEALGLIHITAYNDYIRPRDWPYFWRRKKPELMNAHIIQELSACLDICESVNWQYIKNAYSHIRTYSHNMLAFIGKIDQKVSPFYKMENFAGGVKY